MTNPSLQSHVLAAEIPTSVQALMNLQTSPNGAVAESTLMSVQRAISAKDVQDQPRIASFRHQAHCERTQPLASHLDAAHLDTACASENNMVAANASPFPAVSAGIEHCAQTITPSASLKEWASGPSSQHSHSSSPAVRFARLPVSLHGTHRLQSTEHSPSRSPTPSRASSPAQNTRNVDGAPYHPLARDYPSSSSAGSMWSPGSVSPSAPRSALCSLAPQNGGDSAETATEGGEIAHQKAGVGEMEVSQLPCADSSVRTDSECTAVTATENAALDNCQQWGGGDSELDPTSAHEGDHVCKRIHSSDGSTCCGESVTPMSKRSPDVDSQLSPATVEHGFVLPAMQKPATDIETHDRHSAKFTEHHAVTASPIPDDGACEDVNLTASKEVADMAQTSMEGFDQHAAVIAGDALGAAPCMHHNTRAEGLIPGQEGSQRVDFNRLELTDVPAAAGVSDDVGHESVPLCGEHAMQQVLQAPQPVQTILHPEKVTPLHSHQQARNRDCQAILHGKRAGRYKGGSSDTVLQIDKEPLSPPTLHTEDVTVQASNITTVPKGQHASVSCQCDALPTVDATAQVQPDTAQWQDAAIQNDMGWTTDDNWAAAGGATSPICDYTMPRQVTRGLQHNLDQPELRDDLGDRPTHMPPWVALAPPLSAVTAPDPSTLSAVQCIRARLEALNQEMANVIRHSTASCSQASAPRLQAELPVCTPRSRHDEQRSNHMDCGLEESAYLVADQEPQASVGCETQLARLQAPVEAAKPIKISMSVVTEVPGERAADAVRGQAYIYTQHGSVHTNLHVNGADCTVKEQNAVVIHEHKACQVDDGVAPQPPPLPPSPQGQARPFTADELPSDTVESPCDERTASEEPCEKAAGFPPACTPEAGDEAEVHHKECKVKVVTAGLPNTIQTAPSHAYVGALGGANSQWQCLSESAMPGQQVPVVNQTELYMPCIVDSTTLLGMGAMTIPWRYKTQGAANQACQGDATADALATAVAAGSDTTHTDPCQANVEDTPMASSCAAVSQNASLYALEGAPGSHIQPLMSPAMVLGVHPRATARAKHLKTL
eukprot:jgi/Ulvmu1/8938/UM005_0029.1